MVIILPLVFNQIQCLYEILKELLSLIWECANFHFVYGSTVFKGQDDHASPSLI